MTTSTTSAAAIHAEGSDHPTCEQCDDSNHRSCTDMQQRTRSPRNVETVCCCREHVVLSFGDQS